MLFNLFLKEPDVLPWITCFYKFIKGFLVFFSWACYVVKQSIQHKCNFKIMSSTDLHPLWIFAFHSPHLLPDFEDSQPQRLGMMATSAFLLHLDEGLRTAEQYNVNTLQRFNVKETQKRWLQNFHENFKCLIYLLTVLKDGIKKNLKIILI